MVHSGSRHRLLLFTRLSSWLIEHMSEPEEFPLVARKSQSRLTTKQKFGYGAASLPHGLIGNIKGFFLNAFLLEVAGVPAQYAGIILLGTKAFDAVYMNLTIKLADAVAVLIQWSED